VTGETNLRVAVAPQQVDAPLTKTAIFLVLVLADTDGAMDTARGVVSGIVDLVNNVAIRDLTGHLSCTVGIGARVRFELTGRSLPAELHPFREVVGQLTAIADAGSAGATSAD